MSRGAHCKTSAAATDFAVVCSLALRRGSRRPAVFGCAALFLLSPVPERGALRAQNTSKVRTVLITASGGISKGSYQGGVDWTVSEFLRRQRDSGFRHRVPDSSDVEYVIGSASGASAGNINALFSALAWCTETIHSDSVGRAANPNYIQPEESLFWKAWVNTGFTQLLPRQRVKESEPAVLDRRFFETVQKADVVEFLHRAVPVRGDCNVPVGVTMTKLSPARVPLTDLAGGAGASVQRFASIFRVTKATEGVSAQLDIQSAGDELNKGSLGALALLPGLESTAWLARDKRFADLFDVVLASSSFPVAFAPKKIDYVPGGLLSTPAGSNPPASFSDGGLFDNNPLALAVRLFELSKGGQSFGEVDVALTTPHRLRGVLERNRRSNLTQPDHTGLGAIIQMFQGAWPSAQEYELHSLARLLARDKEIFGSGKVRPVATPRLRLSSRSSAIVGEQLASFGGFLGRSFREYDFYTGIYDGLEFVARNFICGRVEEPAAARTCTEAAHMALVDNNVFDLGILPLSVVAWHRFAEYGGDSSTPVPVLDLERDRWTLLQAVHQQALILKARRAGEIACKPRNDVIASAICESGFDVMLDKLASDTAFKNAAQRLRAWCNRNPQHKDKGECSADDEFKDLLESPRRYLNALAERALNNLEETEDYIKESRPDLPEHSAAVEAVFSQYRAATFRYRTGIKGTGLEMNPSSARVDFRGASRKLGSAFAVAMPNYVNFLGAGRVRDCSVGCGDDHVLKATAVTGGWRPLLWRPAEELYVTSRFELSKYQDQTDTSRPGRKYWDTGFGLSVGSNVWTPKGFSSIELGVIGTRHIVNQELQGVPDKRIGVLHLTGRTFTEKVQFDVRWRKGRAITASVGISDVNGILYWWLR